MTNCELLTLSVVEGVRVGVGVGVVEDEGVEEGDSGKGGRKGRRRNNSTHVARQTKHMLMGTEYK